MQETKRMAEDANRMGQEAQERAQRMGHEFQQAAVGGFETAGRSLSEVNRGFQAIAAEMTDVFQESLRRCHPHLGATHWREVG